MDAEVSALVLKCRVNSSKKILVGHASVVCIWRDGSVRSVL